MFTGLVRDLGVIVHLEEKVQALRLGIQSKLPVSEFATGASIACNGVCLTVCEMVDNGVHRTFLVDVGPETLAATRFGQLKIGDSIHLEPASKIGDALGGHIVTGHVDGLARVVEAENLPEGYKKLVLDIPMQLSQYLIPKGSLSVAGVSLTIAHLKPHPEKPKAVIAEFMLIPHTLTETNLGALNSEDTVEIECDHFCKMVASVVSRMLPNL